jgi:hypothetical protein
MSVTAQRNAARFAVTYSNDHSAENAVLSPTNALPWITCLKQHAVGAHTASANKVKRECGRLMLNIMFNNNGHCCTLP